MSDLDQEVRGALRVFSEACERAFRIGQKGALLAVVATHTGSLLQTPIPRRVAVPVKHSLKMS